MTDIKEKLKILKSDWNEYTDISKGNIAIKSNNGHNDKCCIESSYCSINMSQDLPNICIWHEKRMGKINMVNCECKQHEVIIGDSIGRSQLREYINFHNLEIVKATQDICSLFCCSLACNSLNTIKQCGLMNVCSYCEYEHK